MEKRKEEEAPVNVFMNIEKFETDSGDNKSHCVFGN